MLMLIMIIMVSIIWVQTIIMAWVQDTKMHRADFQPSRRFWNFSCAFLYPPRQVKFVAHPWQSRNACLIDETVHTPHTSPAAGPRTSYFTIPVVSGPPLLVLPLLAHRGLRETTLRPPIAGFVLQHCMPLQFSETWTLSIKHLLGYLPFTYRIKL